MRPVVQLTSPGSIEFSVNGRAVSVADDSASLLEVLRDRLGVKSVKDGCSPQGQCGCCTVLVDGQPRVSCVTPARRVRGRSITTVEGLGDASEWAEALFSAGGSQCGFCTPGIVIRLSAAAAKHGPLSADRVSDALKAHLCRCTGWQSIVEAAVAMPGTQDPGSRQGAQAQAELEGASNQLAGPSVALGHGGFADDTAPSDALVAVRSAAGEWAVAETLTEARAMAAKVQGRRTTAPSGPPIDIPQGDFDVSLQTSWVEPAYLETDASWCKPGGSPSNPTANGGAFGAKRESEVGSVARRLADQHGRAVRVLYSREDTVRLGPKRPPIAAGVNADGSGQVIVAATPGIAEAIASVAPKLTVQQVRLAGPPTSAQIRGAGWVEAAVLLDAARGPDRVVAPNGASAVATFDGSTIAVHVDCGEVLDRVVLRSYCIGAAHMAYSWVTSEALAVDHSGEVQDLTVRSFGVVRATDTPHIEVSTEPSQAPPLNGSDAVFAAVAAAVWRHLGHPPSWPTG